MSRFVLRIALCLAAGLVAIGARPPMVYAAPPKRVGIVRFRGPHEGATRNSVMRAIKVQRYQVVGSEQIRKTAQKLRIKLDGDDGFAELAKALRLSAVVTGEVSKKKAVITIRAGESGATVDQATWTARNPRQLSGVVWRAFWRRFRRSIERPKPSAGSAEVEPVAKEEGKPGGSTAPEQQVAEDAVTATPPSRVIAAPPASVPHPVSPSRAPASGSAGPRPARISEGVVATTVGSSEDRDTGTGPSLEVLDFAVGPRLGRRSLSYIDDPNSLNSSYSLAAAPLAAATVDFFPGALSSQGPLANIGATFAFSYMLLVKSQFTTGGAAYHTSSLAWSTGLKARLPLGMFLTAAVGEHLYRLVEENAATATDVPGTDYRFIRGGGGLRRRLSPHFVLMAQAAYLYCLKLGQIGEAGYFPRATGWGLEAGAALGVTLTPHLELRVGADAQRFHMDFHVTGEDTMNGALTAGGATDQYLEAWIALAFVIGAPRETLPSQPRGLVSRN